jgi:hypothetical protein
MADSTGETFASFWIGPRLQPLANACINSFLAHGFNFELYTHGPVEDVPRHASVRDAEPILPHNELFISHGGVETSTELFSYRYLRRFGGWVVDLDVACNAQRVPDVEIAFAEERAGIINNAVLKFPQGHPAIEDLLKYVATIDPVTAPWGSTGPLALSKIFVEHSELQPWKLPMRDVYPLHWKEAPKVLFPDFTEEVLEKTEGAPFIHLWGATLRELEFDPWHARPVPGSYLAIFYEKYLDRHILDTLQTVDETRLRRSVEEHAARHWGVSLRFAR